MDLANHRYTPSVKWYFDLLASKYSVFHNIYNLHQFNDLMSKIGKS